MVGSAHVSLKVMKKHLSCFSDEVLVEVLVWIYTRHSTDKIKIATKILLLLEYEIRIPVENSGIKLGRA